MITNEQRIAERPTVLAQGERHEFRMPPPLSERDHSVLARELIVNTVTTVFDVDADLILLPTRGQAPTARARQVAMYLAHVACELSLTAVGRMFERDRTTVAHACSRVEDARERPDFNRVIGMMERSVRAIVRASPVLRRDLARAEMSALAPRSSLGEAA